jgi:hypothetical protein
MSTGSKCRQLSGALLLATAFLCIGGPGNTAHAEQTQAHRKTSKLKKKTPPPPLPSGPTGPVQQIPLDSIAAVPPQVSFQNNELTIVAQNSTLSDILRAIRKQTGAEIEVPAAPERVVTRLGPGPARDVLADLLNGSRFNYVLLGSPGNEAILTRVVLVPKQTQPAVAANNPEPQPDVQPPPQPPQDDSSAEAVDESSAEESAPDETAEQPAAEAEQPANSPDQQQNIKTPQQMLQEMQQRQMMQQGQPGSGMPPHPPQQQ